MYAWAASGVAGGRVHACMLENALIKTTWESSKGHANNNKHYFLRALSYVRMLYLISGIG